MQRLMNFLGFSEIDQEDEGAAANGEVVELPRRRTTLLNLHAQKQEIVVLQPRTFDDARDGADYLKMRRPIVVNLQGTPPDLARRIVDFTSGVTYALDGHLLRVGEQIFLFTPAHVAITADAGSGDDSALFPLQ
ncbi:MAG: cell division protein SepF [Armatimonadota bacterium]|nr:cell division protein SepF [Armatimonadota bacterium]MDR7451769.1 cell division protein SepF [Armatimonadota bacterium]MDR7467394.1 cell division protein SepF [Armatimonadota bacterium]MDR7494164.1 cell division protein SepF [Armatimonadota bacterium]MDR7498870.1 cell division protein SepF [Armatimonadota bacterium]